MDILVSRQIWREFCVFKFCSLQVFGQFLHDKYCCCYSCCCQSQVSWQRPSFLATAFLSPPLLATFFLSPPFLATAFRSPPFLAVLAEGTGPSIILNERHVSENLFRYIGCTRFSGGRDVNCLLSKCKWPISGGRDFNCFS